MIPAIANRAPAGSFFYVVSPTPQDPKRTYLHAVRRPQKGGTPKILMTHSKGLAMKFSSRQLCGAYVMFLVSLPIDTDFSLAME